MNPPYRPYNTKGNIFWTTWCSVLPSMLLAQWVDIPSDFLKTGGKCGEKSFYMFLFSKDVPKQRRSQHSQPSSCSAWLQFVVFARLSAHYFAVYSVSGRFYEQISVATCTIYNGYVSVRYNSLLFLTKQPREIATFCISETEYLNYDG